MDAFQLLLVAAIAATSFLSGWSSASYLRRCERAKERHQLQRLRYL